MIKLKSSLLLRFVSMLLLVLSLSASTLCHSVTVLAADAGSDVTYQVAYQNEVNQWVDITSSGGATVGSIGREYRVRFRFRMPEAMKLNQPYDISFVLNHQASPISGINLTVGDINGTILSSTTVSYSSIVSQQNSSQTRTTISIYSFKCDASAWITLSFSYYSYSTQHPSQSNLGYIACGVTSFTIVDSSTDATIIDFKNTVHNDFMDLIESESQFSQDIIDNQNEIASDIIDNQNEIASQAHSDAQNISDSIDNGFSYLHEFNDGLLGSLQDFFRGINSWTYDFFTNIYDTLADLLAEVFIPDIEDIRAILDGAIETWQEDVPLLGNLMTIFQGFLSSIASGQRVDHFDVPSFTIPLPQDTTWTVQGFSVPLFPSGLSDLLDTTRLFTALVTTILVARLILSRIFDVLGFKPRNNVVDVEEDSE